jgi:hypothetical protein
MTANLRSLLNEYLCSLVAAATLYAAYAQVGDNASSVALAAVAVYFFVSLPAFSRISNRLDTLVAVALTSAAAGRMARLLAQYLYNFGLYLAFIRSGLVDAAHVDTMGGPVVGALATTLASNAFQHVALRLSANGVGRDDANVTLAVCLTVLVTAAAVLDVPHARAAFLAAGAVIGLAAIGRAALRTVSRSQT